MPKNSDNCKVLARYMNNLNKISNCTTKSALKEGTLTKSSRARIINHHQNSDCAQGVIKVENNSTLIRRREALGFSFCFGLAEVLSQAQPSDAAEAAAPCQFIVAPSGLAFCDKVVGYGPEASKGQLIKAHYVGKLENGKVFDSSYNRGKPLTFRVGVGEVIKGWDQGILGGEGIPPMLTGGKRTLKLPPELGYGMRGAGCKGGSCLIPPDSVLLFDVEFIGKA